MELAIENEEFINQVTNQVTNETQELEVKQKNFLESEIGQVVNTALDIGIKAVLPDLIEDQIINIKDTILEQGFKEGLKEVINSGIDIGKSAVGIVTGNFENISQVQLAIKSGGILDNISKLLNSTIDLAKKHNVINSTVATMLKQGKNTIISSISNKIEESLTNQLKAVEKLENYCEKWNTYYGEQDFSKMETAYKNIEKYLEKVMPLENVISKARRIENIHNLIKNNGKDFNLTESEIELAEKFN